MLLLRSAHQAIQDGKTDPGRHKRQAPHWTDAEVGAVGRHVHPWSSASSWLRNRRDALCFATTQSAPADRIVGATASSTFRRHTCDELAGAPGQKAGIANLGRSNSTGFVEAVAGRSLQKLLHRVDVDPDDLGRLVGRALFLTTLSTHCVLLGNDLRIDTLN